MKLAEAHFLRAGELEGLGFKPADALHVTSGEALGVAVVLSCDDRLVKLATRCRARLRVRVANPVDWLSEIGDGTDAGADS